jgi:two-component system, OmpR family, sensor histidine kinase MprB
VTLRTRITIATAAAVAIAIVLAAFAAYNATSSTLHAQIDNQLVRQASAALHRYGPDGGGPNGPQAGEYGGAGGFVELVNSSGQLVAYNSPSAALPVAEASTAVARAGTGAAFGEVTAADGTDLRVLAVPVASGVALQVAQPLTQVNATLDNLRRELIIISLAGIAIAAIAGAVVAAGGLRPVRALAADVDHVARTGDLSHRIEVSGNDEPAMLARRFNEMLEGLEQARHAQDQLIADASHELRTPLTALRANVELLASGAELDPEDRRKLTEDLTVQLDGVGALVGDLVLLARGERALVNPVPVELDEVAEDAAARARAWWPDAEITVATEPTPVMGDPDALARAVSNLIDNGVKHGGGRVEVTVAGGVLRVRDHGPGVPADEADQVFARFWRGPHARSRPGSGLGLSIVQQVAASHGGTVTLVHPDGGGAEFDLALPVTPGAAPAED